MNPSHQVTPTAHLDHRIDDGLNLLGADLPLQRIRVGELLPLNFYWQANSAQPPDRQVCFHLVRPNEARDLSCRDLVAGFPTQQWRSGDVWRGVQRVKLPPTLPGGDFDLQISVDQQHISLGPLHIDAPEHVMTAPTNMSPQPTSFADWAMLAGFAAPTQIQAGTTFTVQLVWHSTGQTDGKYKVLVQVRAADGTTVAKHDGTPAAGAHPTSTWVSGEYIRDSHPITLPSTLPAGSYTLAITMYEEFTGQRLITPDGHDSVVLSQTLVVP